MPDLNVYLNEFNTNRSCAPDSVYNTDVLHKASIATSMKNSRIGNAALKNTSAKCPDPVPLQGAAVIYDVNQHSIASRLKASPQTYASLRSNAPKLSERPKTAGFVAIDAKYDTSSSDMYNRVRASPLTYASALKSKTSRSMTLDTGKDSPIHANYNTDVGNQSSLAKRAASASRKKYHFNNATARIMPRSEVLGITKQVETSNSHSSYNVNTGHKKEMYQAIIDSPVKFAYLKPKAAKSMSSSSSKDAVYNTNQGDSKEMTTAILDSGTTVSSMKSSVSRFGDNAFSASKKSANARRAKGDAAKRQNTKRRKQKKTRVVVRRNTSNLQELKQRMNVVKPRFAPEPSPMYDTDLGPGWSTNVSSNLTISATLGKDLEGHLYRVSKIRDSVLAKDFKKGVPSSPNINNTTVVPKRCLQKSASTTTTVIKTGGIKFSTVKRFNDPVDSTKLLGPTLASVKSDNAAWNKPSRAMVFRESKEMTSSNSQETTTSTIVQSSSNIQSARTYNTSFASKGPRLAALSQPTAVSHLIGPGSYNTPETTTENSIRPSSAFVSLGRSRKKFPRPTTATSSSRL